MNQNNSFESSDHSSQVDAFSTQNTGYSSFELGAFNVNQGTQVDDTQSSQNFSIAVDQQQFITINWNQNSSDSNHTPNNTNNFNNNDTSCDERLNTQDFFLTSQDFFSNSQISSSQESNHSEYNDSWNQ